jgi:hypothetical protein
MCNQYGAALRRRFENFRWRFPEYWMLALSAAAWLFLAARRGGHAHQQGMLANWLHWVVMVVAMMLPIQIQGVRRTAEQSLWSRRRRSIAGYLVGYVSVWALAGLPLAWASAEFGLTHRINWTMGAAIGFIIAAAWLVSPCKAIATRMCHRTSPLSPLGWKADLACVSYGWISGCACVFNCWPLMLVCWLSGHSLVIMSFAFGLGWADRHFAPNYKAHALLLTAVASIFGVYSQVP